MGAIAALPGLVSIDVGKTSVTNAGIAKIKGLRNLIELELTGCEGITDGTLPSLKEFYGLKKILAKGTKLSREAADQMRKAGITVELGDDAK
jgi:hypothetical protein